MPFSNLFALLVLLGVIPIFVGLLTGGTLYIFLIYNAVLVLLLITDYFMTPGKKFIEVQRQCEEKFSLGTENEVMISVRNNSGYILDMTFRDEVPEYFDVKEEFVRIISLPHVECQGKYYVIPLKRGEFTFGKVHCRYRGVLKLCLKSAVFDLDGNYKVYPDLKDMRKFSLSTLKKSQMIYGMKKTKAYGIGTEFESLREYSEGDDYRKVNWMATARSNKLIVNTYEPEKNQQIFILLDSSRVMNSEIKNIKKLDYAINSAFLLADTALKKGDNTGLMVFDSEVKRFIKPGKGLGQFQLIAENLYNVQENFVSADYRGALAYLNEYQKRRSLLCIFTELFNADEALRMAAALKSIARRHIPLIITIKDMRLYDMANSDIKELNDVYNKSAAIKLADEREKVKKIFFESGIACLDIPPDKLSMEVVNKYLSMKSMMQI